MNYKDVKIFCGMTIEYLREYSAISTIHGVRYLVEKRFRVEKYRRIFWAIILILSLSGCIYMMNGIWMKYQNNPIVVSFATESTPIYEIPFPAVTICPESKYEIEKLNHTRVYEHIKEERTITPKKLESYNFLNKLCQLAGQDEAILEGNRFFGENFFQVIEKLKPVFKPNVSFLNIRNDAFLFPVITDVGICYSFNILDRSEIFREKVIHYSDYHLVANQMKKNCTTYDIENGYVKNSDKCVYPLRGFAPGNDLGIIIHSKYNDFDLLCNPFFDGYRVVLHNPYDIPRPSKNFFSIPRDNIVTVALQPDLIITSEAIKKYKPDIRKCFLKNERSLMYFKIYSEANCRLECLTNFTLNTCGCVEFFMPRFIRTKICGTGSFNCSSKAEDEMLMEEQQTELSGKINTKCGCLPLCTDLSFNVEISQTDFIWRDNYFYLKNEENDDTRTASLLSIYFKREKFMTLVRNEMYGVVDLVSNFGGLLGLFVGFSLLSLVEIIYFFTIRIYCNSYSNRSNINRSMLHTITVSQK